MNIDQKIIIFEKSQNEISANSTHGVLIERIWTATPSSIPLLIAKVSFSLLYIMEEVSSAAIRT